MNAKRLGDSVLLLLVLVATAFIVWGLRRTQRLEELSLSEVASAANEGRIERISVLRNELTITFTDGSKATAFKESGGLALEQLATLGVSTERLSEVDWEIRGRSNRDYLLDAIMYIVPMIVVAGFFYRYIRQAQPHILDQLRDESDPDDGDSGPDEKG